MNPRNHVAARAALALSCALASSSLVGCSHSEPAPEKKPVPVKVRTVEKSNDTALARYSGTLEPAASVQMAFRVNGYVEALAEVTANGAKPHALDKGDFVKKGTMLARIRSTEYAQKLATARAQINEARSESKLADSELARSQKLFESKAITKAELDAKVAKAEYATASVEGATARAGEASVSLEDTVLRAPMDGVVLSRDCEVGTLVSPGQRVLSIADVRTVKATFGVPQALVEKLRIGSPVQVFVGADGESASQTLDATVTRIAPAADSKGRVFAIEASLPNPTGALRPGSVVSVHLPDATLAQASVAVPLSAIVRSPGGARGFSVFVLDDTAGSDARARAHVQTVGLGEVLGNSVTVIDGLRLGQRVVTVGSTLLRDGSDTVVIP